MKHFPDFQFDLMLSENAPAADGLAHEATGSTGQPVPLAPQRTGVLEPISGSQIVVLTLFGVLAFVMLIAMTRYGRNNNYGD